MCGSFKRTLHLDFADPALRDDAKFWPSRIVSHINGKSGFEVQYDGRATRFAFEEISAMLLTAMRSIGQSHLSCHGDCRQAVITVPAAFDFVQRQAVKDAAAIAGLECLRLCTSGEAAALAYSVAKRATVGNEERIVLIFDMGGGFMDASLVKIENHVLEMLAARWALVGGDDLDRRIVMHLAQVCRERCRWSSHELKTRLRVLGARQRMHAIVTTDTGCR